MLRASSATHRWTEPGIAGSERTARLVPDADKVPSRSQCAAPTVRCRQRLFDPFDHRVSPGGPAPRASRHAVSRRRPHSSTSSRWSAAWAFASSSTEKIISTIPGRRPTMRVPQTFTPGLRQPLGRVGQAARLVVHLDEDRSAFDVRVAEAVEDLAGRLVVRRGDEGAAEVARPRRRRCGGCRSPARRGRGRDGRALPAGCRAGRRTAVPSQPAFSGPSAGRPDLDRRSAPQASAGRGGTSRERCPQADRRSAWRRVGQCRAAGTARAEWGAGTGRMARVSRRLPLPPRPPLRARPRAPPGR